MKRALFSSEAGLGSAPIAHSAVKTKEPVTEGVVAGLEPFIDTVVVCTITALVILTSGVWQRDAQASFDQPPAMVETAAGWAPAVSTLPEGNWQTGSQVFMVVESDAGRQPLFGSVEPEGISWRPNAAA